MLASMRMRFGSLNPELLNKVATIRNTKAVLEHEKRARKVVLRAITNATKTGIKCVYMENYWLTDKIIEELVTSGFVISDRDTLKYNTLISW